MAKLDTWIHCCSCQSEWLGNKARYDIEIAEKEPCPYCSDKGHMSTTEICECSNCIPPASKEDLIAMLEELLDCFEAVVRCESDWSRYHGAIKDSQELIATLHRKESHGND